MNEIQEALAEWHNHREHGCACKNSTAERLDALATPDRADPEPLAQRIAAAMDAMGLEGNRPNIVYAREIVDRASLATPDRADPHERHWADCETLAGDGECSCGVAALASTPAESDCCYGPQGHDPQDPHMFATPDRAKDKSWRDNTDGDLY